MNVFKHFQGKIIEILNLLVTRDNLPTGLDYSKVVAEPPRDSSHGDIATNAAMVLSKQSGTSPQQIAGMIIAELIIDEQVESAEMAGPGFINIRVKNEFWLNVLKDILNSDISYGDSDLGQGIKTNIEYVSVNPTGPMHVGHCRGAVVGDVLAELMKKAGYDVCKEFYVNDAGNQVNALAESLYYRYCQLFGQELEEHGGYPGDYIIPVAQNLKQQVGDKWLNKPKDEWLVPLRDYVVKAMMDIIKDDLALINVHHDVFTSEKAIVESGRVDEAFKILNDIGMVYTGVLEPPKGKLPEDWEPRPQVLFKSTAYGDDIDRPLKKSDGTWTYFAPDIAYHYDKYKRGFTNIIDILGADHGGYVKRIAAATKAISGGKAEIDVKLCQLVKFLDKGEAVKMSKRADTFISVRDVVERVGSDVLRFIMLTRKNDATLDFDFEKVAEQSKDNPVFYVQYAHARTCSIKRHLKEVFPDLDTSLKKLANADLSLLTNPEDIAMIKVLAEWPRQVEVAAIAHEPHRIAYYLYDVASKFHGLWTMGNNNAELRFIYPNDILKTSAKFALVEAVAVVIASGLKVFGVKPIEEMR